MTRGTRYRTLRGSRAAIVAGHPAAVASGTSMLERGGNAVDAAVAAAAALAVVRPHMCGLGGDGFIQIYESGTRRIYALNAAGPAPYAIDADYFKNGIPDRGPLITTVPGIVDGWAKALERFGTMPWKDVLQPAIRLAESGFPVFESLARWFSHYEGKYAADETCASVFFPKGRAPKPGELLVQPDLAHTMGLLAETGPREFYEGAIAARYVELIGAAGGVINHRDLTEYCASWSEPLHCRYRDYSVYTQPPMSQGWMLTQLLTSLNCLDIEILKRQDSRVANLARLVRCAFEDRDRLFGDPRFVSFNVEMVLSERRLKEIGHSVSEPLGLPLSGEGGDTTSLSVVDAAGNAVSLIQSLWIDAGIMLPGTGILLNGRLNSCSPDRTHPNCIAGGKIPVHSMHTYMLTLDDELVLTGGSPGGNGQVQTNVQVITNIIDLGMNPQEAVEAPRFLVGAALGSGPLTAVSLEGRFPDFVSSTIAALGYEVMTLPDWAEIELEGQSPVTVGSAKIIAIDPNTGVRSTGVDPRREAYGLTV